MSNLCNQYIIKLTIAIARAALRDAAVHLSVAKMRIKPDFLGEKTKQFRATVSIDDQ